MERVALPSGAWADVATSITYGIRRRVQLARVHATQRADAELRLQADAETIAAMVLTWSLVDAAGAARPVTVASVDAMDARDADALFIRCAELYVAGTADLSPKVEASSPHSLGAQP